MHIRNLLLTYFLRFFEELVTKGHVYIFENPLFRVRTKGDTRYCYTEAERNAAMAAIKSPEGHGGFKGLGEISPNEFKQFIRGDDMRIQQVSVESLTEVKQALEFYMGKNTPDRQDYIIQNLIYETVWAGTVALIT